MNLWVRSQDKRILQKVDNIYLNANYDNRRICTNDNRDILTYCDNLQVKINELIDEVNKLKEN